MSKKKKKSTCCCSGHCNRYYLPFYPVMHHPQQPVHPTVNHPFIPMSYNQDPNAPAAFNGDFPGRPQPGIVRDLQENAVHYQQPQVSTINMSAPQDLDVLKAHAKNLKKELKKIKNQIEKIEKKNK